MQNKFENLSDDISHVKNGLFRLYVNNYEVINTNTYLLNFRGLLFSIEIDYQENHVLIQTYLLIRDAKIFNSYNKHVIDECRIMSSVDDKGQVRHYFGGSSTSYMGDDFIREIKMHEQALENFVNHRSTNK